MENLNRSKSKKVRLSTHNSRQTESLAPLDEEGTQQMQNENMSIIDMLATVPPYGSVPAPQPPSLLRRLSSFFTEAKLPKAALLRKQVPGQYTAAALTSRQPAPDVVNKDSRATDQLPTEPPVHYPSWDQLLSRRATIVEASNNPRVPISNPRVVSAPLAKKPPAPHTSEDEAGANTFKKRHRRSKALLGGSGSQRESWWSNPSKEPEMAVAWVIDGKSKVGYDIVPLLRANKVSLLNSLVSKLPNLLPESRALV
jgi:hypothetical protein